jgi:hypothetical protein
MLQPIQLHSKILIPYRQEYLLLLVVEEIAILVAKTYHLHHTPLLTLLADIYSIDPINY